MSKTDIFCICTIAVALIGCTKNVYLEEQTPPGTVPSAVSDDGSAQLDQSASTSSRCKCKATPADGS